MTHPLKTPDLEFISRLNISLDAPLEIGETSQGKRRFIPITGGAFRGDELNGRIVPGGGDWQTIRPDGVAILHARYMLETDDGVLIEVNNWGYRHGPAEIIHKLQQGERVDPDHYYFKTTPRFTTASPDHDWLNRTIFIGSAERRSDEVIIDVFRVS